MNDKVKEKRLFSEFTPPSKSDWIEKAKVDLKGADFNKKLVWKNLNDFEVQPFYTLEERKSTLPDSGWNESEVVNYRRILRHEKNKNQLALKALAEGITGILFEVDSADAVEDLMQDLNPEKNTISFSLGEPDLAFCQSLSDYFNSHRCEKAAISGYLEIPSIGRYLTEGVLKESTLDTLANVVRIFSDYPNLKTLTVSGREYLDSGANQVQEIAFTLNSVVHVVEEMKKRDLDETIIYQNLHVILGIGSEYFVEIAKLRAFNSLMHLVAEKYGVEHPGYVLMARSSIWTKSVMDAHTNMLRATTETMSALLGNSQAIEIDPYDSEMGASKDFSKRIAGNIATILREESYFGKVRNPVDGSYYIEQLTERLAENGLLLFKDVEKLGGFFKGVESNYIQNKIALVRTTRTKLLSRRRKARVGVNKYPNLMEDLKPELLGQDVDQSNPKLLKPRRAGLELEMIRSKTETFVAERGYRPVVEFAGFGNLTMRKARAGFAFDFLGVGGYKMDEEKAYSSAKIAAETSASSSSDIVVMCSSDQDYLDSALEFVTTFRAIDKNKVLILAGCPETMMEKLKESGLDTCIHMRSDILETLDFIHKKIIKTSKTLKI
ncbi:MAG: methylmalonyl-CoA mutase family protein [Lutimonas sp.]